MILLTLLLLISFNSYAFNCHYVDSDEPNVDTLISSSTSFIILSSFDTVKTAIEGGFIDDYVTTLSIYNSHSDSLLQTIKDTSQEFSFPQIKYVDINLDSFSDIELMYQNDRLTQYSYFWIFDTVSNRFVNTPEFGLNDYSIDKKNKIIESSIFCLGCFCSTFSKYKVIGNNLIQIEEEGCYKNSEGNIESYKKGLVDNVLIIVKLDSILFIDSLIVIKSYNIFNDSLLVSEIYWLENKEVKLTNNSNEEIFYESEFIDLKKAIKKVLYKYKINSNGNLITNIDSYKVDNNKWVKIK